MNLKIDGLEELIKTLNIDAPKEVKNLTRAAVQSIASDMAKEIKLAAPVGDTGLLRKSIKAKRNNPKSSAVFSSRVTANAYKKGSKFDAFYWKFLEFGTRKMPARPFIKPIKQKYRQNMKKLMEDAVLAKLAKNLSKKSKLK